MEMVYVKRWTCRHCRRLQGADAGKSKGRDQGQYMLHDSVYNTGTFKLLELAI